MRANHSATRVLLACWGIGLGLACGASCQAVGAEPETPSVGSTSIVRLARPVRSPRKVLPGPAKRRVRQRDKVTTASTLRMVPLGRLDAIARGQSTRSTDARAPTSGVPEKRYQDLTIDTTPDLRNLAAGRTSRLEEMREIQLPEPTAPPEDIGLIDRTYQWHATAVTWTAPQFFHRPLYFEQPNLERYGHFTRHWHLASAASAAHFFGTLPALPYKIGRDRPCERIYTLGYLRPGDCNPHQKHPRGVSDRGVLLQSVVVGGLIFLIP